MQQHRVALFFQDDIPLEQAKIRGILQYLRRRRQWDIPLLGRKPRVTYEQLINWHGDGIIGNISNNPEVDALLKKGIKIVRTSSPHHEDTLSIPTVSVDSFAIGRLAAEHLLTRSFHRFLFAGVAHGKEDNPLHFQQREKSFMETIRSRGFPCKRHWFTSPCTEDFLEGASWVPCLKKLTFPVAIFACCDYAGFGILRACRRLGIHVPNEVAVLGADNDDVLCQLAIPRMSSVDPGGENVGYRAAAVLDRLLSGDDQVPAFQKVSPAKVRLRASSNVIATSNMEVAEALRFIYSHAQDPINVQDVMRVMTISRRTLERHFREETGQSIAENIRNTRLEMAIQMLEGTSCPVEEIARNCGFTNAPRLNAAFRKVYGCTAAEYRCRFAPLQTVCQ